MKPIPNKWVKRGPQPEVAPTEVSQAMKTAALLSSIRECTNPVEKLRLETEFQDQCKTYDEILYSTPQENITEIHQEIMKTISIFSSENQPGITVPAEFNKEQWAQFHSRLFQCKRMAGGWLLKSRQFASERWGQDFVESSERQMELDLGIEHKPGQPDANHMSQTRAMTKTLDRWASTVIAKAALVWSDEADKALSELADKAARLASSARRICREHREGGSA